MAVSLYTTAGFVVRCSVVFTDLLTEEIADPGTVKFTYQVDRGTQMTYTYGVGGEIVKDEVGEYHIDLDTTDQPGEWVCEFIGESGLQANESVIVQVAAPALPYT